MAMVKYVVRIVKNEKFGDVLPLGKARVHHL